MSSAGIERGENSRRSQPTRNSPYKDVHSTMEAEANRRPEVWTDPNMENGVVSRLNPEAHLSARHFNSVSAESDVSIYAAAEEAVNQTEAAIKQELVDQQNIIFQVTTSELGDVWVCRAAPYEKPLLTERKSYRLSDLIQRFQTTGAEIIHWIKRHKLLAPSKDRNYGDQKVYDFSPEDVAKADHIYRLKGLGYKIGEIVKIMGDQEAYDQVAERLDSALMAWRENRTSAAWTKVVAAVAETPTLTEIERQVFINMNTGFSFEECAYDLNLAANGIEQGENQVRGILNRAQSKIDCNVMMRLLYSMGEKR